MIRRSLTSNLKLEALDERAVPSATQLDLTTRGAEQATAGFIARQSDAQPTGTGVIRSFVRVQGASSGGGSEHGYNTTARPLQFDENKSPQFTRSLRVGDVPVVEVGGVRYREFLLDINQKSSSSRLSVDEVRIFLGDRPDLLGYSESAKTLNGGRLAFDLDASGDVSVMLDARLNSGSGSGDMVLLVPDAALAAAGGSADTFLYLYSKMGGQAGATANGGFEEWAVKGNGGGAPVAPPPPVALGSLSGYVYLDFDGDGRRGGIMDRGIAGVTIKLQGVNDLGETVVLTAVTGADGSYTFGGLRPGEYTLLEESGVPTQYADGTDTLGTLGGQMENDKFFGIVVRSGDAGKDYNFGERSLG